ncbi:MAG TPA: hypothetical protein VIK81_04560 [Patescibacteria group bacterium]
MEQQPNYNDLHVTAMKMASDADMAVINNNEQLASDLRLQAAKLDEQSLENTPRDLSRTRAVIGTSAVTLYFKAGDLANAKRLGEACLEELDENYGYNRNEIKKVLEAVNQSQASTDQ